MDKFDKSVFDSLVFFIELTRAIWAKIQAMDFKTFNDRHCAVIEATKEYFDANPYEYGQAHIFDRPEMIARAIHKVMMQRTIDTAETVKPSKKKENAKPIEMQYQPLNKEFDELLQLVRGNLEINGMHITAVSNDSVECYYSNGNLNPDTALENLISCIGLTTREYKFSKKLQNQINTHYILINLGRKIADEKAESETYH